MSFSGHPFSKSHKTTCRRGTCRKPAFPYIDIRKAIILIFLTSCWASTAVAQQQNHVILESFSVISTNPSSVEVEITGANDGTLGPICLGAVAKSADGSVRSESFPPVIFPDGQHVQVKAQVTRPQNIEKPQTDFLLVMAYSCGQNVISYKRFPWPYLWPRLPVKPATGITDDYADMSINSAWFAFYENLEEEDFAALDMLINKWNTPRERNKNGEWKLNDFRIALNSSPTTMDWNEQLDRIRRWQKFNPQSSGAAIAEAKYWVSYAWHIRGNEGNQDVDPLAMRIFRERMGRAEQILRKSQKFASGNPLWYEAYLDIAIATGRKRKFIEKLFEDGIRQHPYFQPLYEDMTKYWAPWYSRANWEMVDTVINRAVTITSSMDGIDNYAWLYSQISSQQKIETDILRSSHVSWLKMRDSFRELVKRYPSANNLNEFAVFACRAGDKDAFFNVIPLIQDHLVPDKWPSNYSIDLCKHRFMQYS